MEENKNEVYCYKYKAFSPEERKEAESVLREYQKPEPTEIERLRALQSKVETFPKALSISIGVVGTLVFGGGLSLVLEFPSWLWLGVVLAVVGGALIFTAYPLYRYALKTQKAKYGDEIIRLCESILKSK